VVGPPSARWRITSSRSAGLQRSGVVPRAKFAINVAIPAVLATRWAASGIPISIEDYNGGGLRILRRGVGNSRRLLIRNRTPMAGGAIGTARPSRLTECARAAAHALWLGLFVPTSSVLHARHSTVCGAPARSRARGSGSPPGCAPVIRKLHGSGTPWRSRSRASSLSWLAQLGRKLSARNGS